MILITQSSAETKRTGLLYSSIFLCCMVHFKDGKFLFFEFTWKKVLFFDKFDYFYHNQVNNSF